MIIVLQQMPITIKAHDLRVTILRPVSGRSAEAAEVYYTISATRAFGTTFIPVLAMGGSAWRRLA